MLRTVTIVGNSRIEFKTSSSFIVLFIVESLFRMHVITCENFINITLLNNARAIKSWGKKLEYSYLKIYYNHVRFYIILIIF